MSQRNVTIYVGFVTSLSVLFNVIGTRLITKNCTGLEKTQDFLKSEKDFQIRLGG